MPLNHSGKRHTPEVLPAYDLNKSGKADCEDFELWKKCLTQESAGRQKNLSVEEVEKTVVLKQCE